MKNVSFILSAALAIVAIGLAVFAAEGSSSPYTDAIGDIDPTITTANGTLDIVGMEVSNTLTDIEFKLTVNGDVTNPNWAKYMIGIATGKTDGSLAGNGWGRPINLSTDNDPFATQIVGMNYWIGSWVDGAAPNPGVAEFYTWVGGTTGVGTGGEWQKGTNFPASVVAGTTSQITYTVPLANLGLVNGDTFYFDTYSSGGGGGDSAIDSLANPNVSVTGWGGPYTSYLTSAGGPGLNSYTVALIPEPSTIAMAAAAVASGGVLIRRRRRKA